MMDAGVGLLGACLQQIIELLVVSEKSADRDHRVIYFEPI
jgi:hypothetical protein